MPVMTLSVTEPPASLTNSSSTLWACTGASPSVNRSRYSITASGRRAADGSASASGESSGRGSSQAETVAEALDENSARTQRVLDELDRRGIAERDIQTRRFDVSPQYDFDRQTNQRSLAGYRVTNRVDVAVRDLDEAGALLDAVVSAGANEIFGLQFDVADSTAAIEAARRAAMADAKSRAELYAGEAGLAVGKPLQITEQTMPGIGPRPVMMGARMEAASDSVPVAPGELTYSAEIRVRYALERD